MAGYLNQNGNSIGSLLRFIQEQKSQSPMVPPSTEASSPIRGVVQEPLKGPEDTGTQKVVSIRPEGVTGIPKSAPVSQTMSGGVSPAGIGPGRSVESNLAGARFGWAGLGGGGQPLNVPIGVAAANEPGVGLGIPSATKSVGDIVKPSTPSIGTKITPAQTSKGTTVQQVNRTYNPAGMETTMDATRERIAAGDRSLAETQARIAQTEKEIADIDKQIAYYDNPPPGSPEYQKAVSGAKEELQKYLKNRPSPSPTPAPQQPTKSSSGQKSYAAPKVQTSYTAPPQPAYKPPTQSYAPVSKPAPQQSVQQKIATIIKQSPFSWLFGR